LIKEKQEQLAAEQAVAAAKAASEEAEKIRLLEEALEKEKMET
jgi:predicted type IV restriction endonuclease